MEEDIYNEARKRVEKKKKWNKGFGVFVAMSIFFFVLDLVTAGGNVWWYWPVLGWGIGVVIGYFDAYGMPWEKDGWEQEALDKEVRRLGGRTVWEDEPDLELPDLEKRPNYDDQDFV